MEEFDSDLEETTVSEICPKDEIFIDEIDKVWTVSGTRHFYNEKSHEIDALNKGVYILKESLIGFYLDLAEEEFELPKKIYGNDSLFVKRVSKTWNAKKGNLGVLLNGIKGSGKTVTAKMICNESVLPVILITKIFDGMIEFLSSIKEDYILFIDEYEKIFARNENALLALMDGALSGYNRRLFLLTTNEISVSDYLLDRPNRIRYLRSYNEVHKDVIMEMIDDLLVNKLLKDSVVKFISSLNMLTIDIIGNVIDEVNIHDEDPELFKDIFNVTIGDTVYNVYYHDDKGKKILISDTHVGSDEFDEDDYVYINGRRIGVCIDIDEKKVHTVKVFNLNDVRWFPRLDFINVEGTLINISFEASGRKTHSSFMGFYSM